MPPAPFGLLLAIILGVNFSGLFNDIFIADSALYAVIAKTIAETNNYLELYVDGRDWLDKPHFPFWITALSFELLGVNTFAYKLPAFLFSCLALRYVYLFAHHWYDGRTAWWAVLMLASAVHIILSNNDVRAEPFLMALLMASVYHYSRSLAKAWGWQLLAASFFAACAVMTKGIFTLLPIGTAVFFHLALTRQLGKLWHYKWLLSALLIGLFVLPELYALYIQFDLHPEKVVYGQKGFSGLRFFFWDSQFGRFVNTGPIKGKGDWWFIPQTTLWAFGPWALLLYGGMVQVFRGKWTVQEWFCLPAYLVMLLLFSSSSFQLSHYMNIVFPFAAVLTGHFLLQLERPRAIRNYRIGQWIYLALIGGLILGVELLLRSGRWWWLGVLALLAIAMNWGIRRSTTDPVRRITYYSTLGSMVIGLYLNAVFYPVILRYQSGIPAARWVNEHYPTATVGAAGLNSWLFEFYLDRPLQRVAVDTELPELIWCDRSFLFELAKKKDDLQLLTSFGHYHTTALTLPFLQNSRRATTLEPRYLVRTTAR